MHRVRHHCIVIPFGAAESRLPRSFVCIVVLCALLPLCFGGRAAAQGTGLGGTVRDANTLRPIPDVRVIILPDSTVLAVSDAAGRYRIPLARIRTGSAIAFNHVSYEYRSIPADSLRQSGDVSLRPRVIPLEDVEVTGMSRTPSDRLADLPHLATDLDARSFETQGYLDAGDLLRVQASIQVDEKFSGEKTLSLRGGNADDVVVLYDGIRMNSVFDNVVDLSNIDLADIERIEIVKGGNTVLFGPDAPAGVVNIIPKTRRDYRIRFQQQIGSYDAGLWGAQGNTSVGVFDASYGVRSGGQARGFTDVPGQYAVNKMLQHNASSSVRLGTDGESAGADVLTAHWSYGTQEYDNPRDIEEQHDRSYTVTARYRGRIATLPGFRLSGSAALMDRSQSFAQSHGIRNRRFGEQTWQLDAGHSAGIGPFEIATGYQYVRSTLDAAEFTTSPLGQRFDPARTDFTRDHHGLFGIAKLRSETDDDFFRHFDVDLSARHDVVIDAVDRDSSSAALPAATSGSGTRSKTLMKFATMLTGMKSDMVFRFFVSYGNSIKFPTLQQQLSVPISSASPGAGVAVLPESTTNIEMAVTVTREDLQDPVLNGWLLTVGYFQTSYDDKIRAISLPGTPILFYDNVQDAAIRGIEAQAGVFFFGKKFSLDIGAAKHFISSASAFPFKSDLKATIGAKIEHGGFTVQALWFAESEQTGLLRQSDGSYAEATIPAFSSIDIHAGASFEIGPGRLFAAVGGRNLLQSGDVTLRGLALHDRRYTVTVGAQL